MGVWSENVTSKMIIESERFDGEFFRPEYLEIQNKLKDCKKMKNYVREIIHPGEFPRRYSDSGLTVIRAQNVRPMSMELDGNEVFISSDMITNLNKNLVYGGDVLTTRTGANFGQTSLYNGERENAIVTSHTLIIKTTADIQPEYLSIYLNTFYGRSLINQCMYGSSQPEIAPKFLNKIPIPRFNANIEADISAKVRMAYKLKDKSITLTKYAQELIAKELGLDKLILSKSNSYETNFSEVVNSHRIDAQCYKPEYIDYEKYLRKRGNYNLLRELVQKFVKGKQRDAKSSGDNQYVSIKDIQGLEIYSNEYCSDSADLSLAFRNSLLLAITGATIGKVGIVTRADALAFSGDLLAFSTFNNVDPYYLLAVMLSPIGQSQCSRWITGSTNGHLSPIDVAKFVIPRLDVNVENKIAKLLVESISCKQESEQLLEQAKKRVEELIEGAIE